jgi:hypothetical protein
MSPGVYNTLYSSAEVTAKALNPPAFEGHVENITT